MLSVTIHNGNANQNHNHLTSVKMAIIKKAHNKCWEECGEKGTLLPCWWECKWVLPLWRTVWRRLKKLIIELLYDTAVPLLCVYKYLKNPPH